MKNNTAIKQNKGFVLLFAVMISSIVLAITLGVIDVLRTELKLSASARDSNSAFFAADTGIEFALYSDKPGVFVPPPGGIQTWPWTIHNLGANGQGCVKITITKDNTNTTVGTTTTIVSKGYNIGAAGCNSTNPDRIERELLVRY